MRRIMLSALAAICAAGPVVAGEAHGVKRSVVCFVIAIAAGSMAYAAQGDQKGVTYFLLDSISLTNSSRLLDLTCSGGSLVL